MGQTVINFIQDFKRDFVVGDEGEDVAKLHRILGFLGYTPSEEELKKKRFGESTLAQAEKMREDLAKNPIMGFFANLIMQFVFGMDPEEAAPDLRRGAGKPIRNYRSGNDPELQSLGVVPSSKHGLNAAAELASRYIGQRETGDNAGAVVKYFNGAEGQPWCGGFVHKIMSETISPELFSQKDFLRARSFEDEAAKYGAFRRAGSPFKPYSPQVGDVVVFSRGAGKGHVGIISEVGEDGKVSYISGNDGNAVRARSFDSKNPPQSLIGYADTQTLAKAKGIEIEPPSQTPVRTSRSMLANVRSHSDAAIRGG